MHFGHGADVIPDFHFRQRGREATSDALGDDASLPVRLLTQ